MITHHSHTHTDTGTCNHILTVIHTLEDKATCALFHTHRPPSDKNVHTIPHGHPFTSKPKYTAIDHTPLPHHSSSLANEVLGSWILSPRSSCPEDRYRYELMVIPELRTKPMFLTTLFSTPHHYLSPGNQADLHLNPDTPLTSCVTWSMLHNLSVLRFPY